MFSRHICLSITLISLFSLSVKADNPSHRLRGGWYPNGATLEASPEVIPNRNQPSNWTAKITLSWDGAHNGHFIGFYYSVDASYPFGVVPIDSPWGTKEVEAYNFRQPFVYKILQKADPNLHGLTNQKLRDVFCKPDFPIDGCERDDTDFLSVWSIQAGNVIAVSNTVRFEDQDAPQQLRLALGNTPTEMRVMWTSATAGGTPKVRL